MIAVAKAAEEGRSLREIMIILEDIIPRIHVCAALDTLEFMRRSGRVSIAVAGIGQLLRIKPLRKMHDSQPSSEKVRTRHGALKRPTDLLSQLTPLEEFSFLHSAANRVAEFRPMVESLLPQGEIIITDIDPVLGAHIDPQVVGFACIAARK